MNALKRIKNTFRNHSSLGIILAAALLLELIAGVQYWYSHNLVEEALEQRAESELTLKAILIKGMLNSMENALKDHAYDASHHTYDSESMFKVVRRLVRGHPHIKSCAVTFVPDYYPERGRLFEPWAGIDGDSIVVVQVGGPNHDYTQMDFYKNAMGQKHVFWTDPYEDVAADSSLITSLAIGLDDYKGEPCGVIGADVHLSWLGDTLNNVHIYPSSYDILLTEGGDLICGPDSSYVGYGSVDKVVALINDSSVTRVKSSSARTDIIEFKDPQSGRDAYVYCCFMRGKPHWQLAVVCYRDEVFAKVDSIRRIVLLLTLLGLFLLGYIVYRSAKNIRSLHNATLEKERINGELRIAKNIQREMLPEAGALPERPDVDVSGLLEPAKAVGGDLYDYFVRDEKLFFCIGDVSGKGVPASLVMSVTHSQFRSTSAHETNPARIVRLVNESSCVGNESNMFVTLFVGVLDLPTGRLRYCNAGHDCPIVLSSEVHELPAKANMPVGLFPDFDYAVQEELLPPGASLFLFTDGLSEARNNAKEFFGQERIMSALKEMASSGLTPAQLLQAMNDRVRAFIGSAEQSDDLTMLAIHYTPLQERNLLCESIELPNDVREVGQLSQFVKSFMQRLGVEKGLASKLRLAIEEAVVNVMEYAYPKGTQGTVTVQADLSTIASESPASGAHMLKVRIIDSGMPFDPTEAAGADTTLSAEERPIGGLGIFLVRELMDSINYEREDSKNILTLKKRLELENPVPTA